MEKMGTLVLFHCELDTLNLFSDQLKQGFEALGYEIFDFDLRQSALHLGLLYDLIQKKAVTAMIGFNTPFFGMQLPSGINMWETLAIPCVNILVDHPYWYHNILMRTPHTGIVLSVDRNHSQYVERFYPHIPCTGFLPHGGTPAADAPKPLSDRKIDVLYAGSLYAAYAATQKPNFARFAFPAEKICEESIEQLLAHPNATIESVIEERLQAADIVLPDEDLRQLSLPASILKESSVLITGNKSSVPWQEPVSHLPYTAKSGLPAIGSASPMYIMAVVSLRKKSLKKWKTARSF